MRPVTAAAVAFLLTIIGSGSADAQLPPPPPVRGGMPPQSAPAAPVPAPPGPSRPGRPASDPAQPALPAPLPLTPTPGATAPPLASGSRIAWEVKNRFRLFRRESDFAQHVAAQSGESVLGAERKLALSTDGRGWARLMVNSLCVDAAGQVLATCDRDGTREQYLSPTDYPVGATLAGAPPGATCAWTFEREDLQPQQVSVPCSEEVRLRVLAGEATAATVDITRPGGAPERATAEIGVKDLLIAGIGDSIAAGEGNPDRPIALEDEGFCFRRVVNTAGSEYYRPGRAGYKGDKTCETASRDRKGDDDWSRHGAGWMNAACHRSLYSYQLRAALALAVENAHLAVTFVPFACTGAGIESGLFGERRARELTCGGPGRTVACPQTVPAQVPRLAALLSGARKSQPRRSFDLILLTVGANDIGFSELVANTILEPSGERTLVSRGAGVATVEDAQAALRGKLPAAFAKLRGALRPLVGGDLARVVYVSYGNPSLTRAGVPCPGGRSGVDVHPAFSINADLVRQASDFVEGELFPSLKALAQCEGGVACKSQSDRMSFVDEHQAVFASHGFCALGEADPAFDRACFSPQGRSFQTNLRQAAEQPLLCGRSVREFRPYAPRARWVRTPNDSYFTAMTYPDGLPTAIQPADLHDAIWGVLSAVYGGAIHPTAEGHAAMADAALPAMRTVLGLAGASGSVQAEPLAAPPE